MFLMLVDAMIVAYCMLCFVRVVGYYQNKKLQDQEISNQVEYHLNNIEESYHG